MRWTTRELHQFKRILKATSSPLSFDSVESFSRAVFEPVLSLAQGHGGQLYITDRSVRQKPVFLHQTYDDGFTEEYRSRFFRRSPLHRVLRRGNLRHGAFDVRSLLDYSRLTKTAFYHEFLKPRGIYHMAGFVSRIPNTGTLVMLGVQRHQSQEPFSETDIEFLDLLIAPTEGAVRTLLLAETAGGLDQVFDRMPVGVLVLDWKLREVYRNALLDELLAGAGLTDGETGLLQAEARRVQDAFEPRGSDEPRPGLGPLCLRRGKGTLQVRVSVLPEGFAGGRRLLMCLFDSSGAPRAEQFRGALKSVHGLTDREIEIAMLCLAGRTNPEMSKELGISTETVKHHLKRVFRKLGLSRRSELAAVLTRH